MCVSDFIISRCFLFGAVLTEVVAEHICHRGFGGGAGGRMPTCALFQVDWGCPHLDGVQQETWPGWRAHLRMDALCGVQASMVMHCEALLGP